MSESDDLSVETQEQVDLTLQGQSSDELVFEVYSAAHGDEIEGLSLVPAHPQRDWMRDSIMDVQHDPNKIATGMANRCLPMLMMNQMGWNVVNNWEFQATSMPDGKMLFWHPGPRPKWGVPKNNFPSGSHLTWPSPWTFKTPPGWDLLILPPPNIHLPEGVTVLQAMVETDHMPGTFTYNWHLPVGKTVFFTGGEVIARLLPYPTAELERFRLEYHDEHQPGFDDWTVDRRASMRRAAQPGGKWEKYYFKIAKRIKIKYRG